MCLIVLVLLVAGSIVGQQQISGGGAVTLSPGANVVGKVGIDQTTPGTTNAVALTAGANLVGKVGLDQTTPGTTNAMSEAFIGSTAIASGNGIAGAGVQRVTIASDNTAFNVNATLAGSALLLGYMKQRPAGCTAAGSSDVVHDTVGVATGAGTSVSAATGCVLECYVNNITNSAVTLRLADKSGTPVIWVGGNADFSIPANSNLGCGGNNGFLTAGVTFTSGITAIAGTAAALNLHIVTRE
jgi:hypothetical protein